MSLVSVSKASRFSFLFMSALGTSLHLRYATVMSAIAANLTSFSRGTITVAADQPPVRPINLVPDPIRHRQAPPRVDGLYLY